MVVVDGVGGGGEAAVVKSIGVALLAATCTVIAEEYFKHARINLLCYFVL